MVYQGFKTIPDEDYLTGGHLACAGCGAALSMRYALKALGPRTVVVIPACCWSIICGEPPYTATKVSLVHVPFETAASTAAGLKAGLIAVGDTETTVMAWAGDGGTFDIGIQALSGAAERNDDFIYCCYDNEAYMNTGIQRSSATPIGAWTTTTPEGSVKDRPKKDIMGIMASHHIPYAATLSLAYPEDFIAKMKKAKEIKGLRFFHIFSPCPPGWRIPDNLTIKLSRLAVHTRIFPLYEVIDGRKWILNVEPENLPLTEYLKLQGRFRYMSQEQIHQLQEMVDRRWEELKLKFSCY